MYRIFIIILFLLVSFVLAQDPPELFEYEQSTLQAFYFFDEILLRLFDKINMLLSDNSKIIPASLAATDLVHKNIGAATRVVRGLIRD